MDRSALRVPSPSSRMEHVTCWSASQATHALRKQLGCDVCHCPKTRSVAFTSTDRGAMAVTATRNAAGDAALLSRAVGRPVRVQWMREDEHGWDPKGPPTLIDLDAALDAKGNLTAWTSAFFLPVVRPPRSPWLRQPLANLPTRNGILDRAASSMTQRYPTRCRIFGQSRTDWKQHLSGLRGFERRVAAKYLCQ